MPKVRVHELAKELNLASADILFHANELGIEVKTASSGLTDDEVELVKLKLDSENDKKEPEKESKSDNNEGSSNKQEIENDKIDTPEQNIEIIEIEEESTASEISKLIETESTKIIEDLLNLGVMASLDTPLRNQDIEKLLEGYGYIVDITPTVKLGRSDVLVTESFDDDENSLSLRSPIITVMGHVDHGKTSLLDYIRKERVADSESGGITQHVGAYKVETGDLGITFIDTPGHEAFTKMRARGADVTDIVVLVVASDDGVMPQTVEAISHTRAAGVPMVVAINKCDLQESNPAKVKADLTQHGVITEDLGGDIPVVEVSAITGEGIDDLLETLSVVAEVEELKSNYKSAASGYIVESRIVVGKGPVSTGIVTRGTLKQGDSLYAGGTSCRARGLFTHNEIKLKEATPGMPVEIMGWDEAPEAGDQFVVVKNYKEAKNKASNNASLIRELESSGLNNKSRMVEMMKILEEGEIDSVNIIIKADTNGSVEAIKDGIEKLSDEDVQIAIVHKGVGGIIESDIDLATATNSIVLGFNVRPDSKARNLAQNNSIQIDTFDIIYELLDHVTEYISGKGRKRTEETVLGMAEVKTIFRAPKVGVVAGSVVVEGRVDKDAQARLLRDGVVVYDGSIVSLRRFKDDVETVNEGLECGIGLLEYRDIKEGDVIEVFGEVEV